MYGSKREKSPLLLGLLGRVVLESTNGVALEVEGRALALRQFL